MTHTSVRERNTRTPLKAVTAATVILAVVAGGAYAAKLGPFDRGSDAPDPAAATQARAFLGDWSAGRYDGAAARTTNPARAQDVLRSFTSGLDIEKPRLTAGSAERGDDGTVRVPFTAKMPVKGLGTWTYSSRVPLREESGTWKVDWALELVHPHLSDKAKFRLEREETSPPEVADRNGKSLVGKEYPSLQPLLARMAAWRREAARRDPARGPGHR